MLSNNPSWPTALLASFKKPMTSKRPLRPTPAGGESSSQRPDGAWRRAWTGSQSWLLGVVGRRSKARSPGKFSRIGSTPQVKRFWSMNPTIISCGGRTPHSRNTPMQPTESRWPASAPESPSEAASGVFARRRSIRSHAPDPPPPASPRPERLGSAADLDRPL